MRNSLRTKNKFEESIYKVLKKRRVKFKYEGVKIPYTLNYIPDFVLETKDGFIYIECKGYLRKEHKTKMSAVKKTNPELDIRIVFYSYNKSNIKWAERNGFKYAIQTIPEEWIKEAVHGKRL